MSGPRSRVSVQSLVAALSLAAALGCSEGSGSHPVPPADSGSSGAGSRRVIVFIWDGLRPDSIDPELTPKLAGLRDEAGVDFRNHHAVYPTLTMMNAAAIATGARSGAHGFYGNSVYSPGAVARDAFGNEVNFQRPVFTEDYGVLSGLDAFARSRDAGGLLRVPTLFETAQAAGLRTAVVGKSGPAFMQDYRQDGVSGVILDEHMVWPRSFGLALQAAGLPLPLNTVLRSYPEGPLELAADNGDPTAGNPPGLVTLADGITPDPRAGGRSSHKRKNEYLMRVFLEYVLPELDPALSLIWLRDPDSSQHTYGPGSSAALDALRNQDHLLGLLLDTLDALGRTDVTDLLIASDHGHSTVGSDPLLFPARALTGAADGQARVGEIAEPGHSVSGEVRTADLLRRAGFEHVYDGVGCVYNPTLSGLTAHDEVLYPVRQDASCGEAAYNTASFDLPLEGALPEDAIAVAANGGSDYLYVPSRDPALVGRVVTALQEREQYGAMFVRTLYGPLAGTFPHSLVGLEAPSTLSPPAPDLVVGFSWNALAETAVERAQPGSEQVSSFGSRGMHGAFSPVDVRATLIAKGPDFRAGFRDEYPSSNVDLAPTIASLLGLPLPHAQGRVLDEALRGREMRYEVEPYVVETEPSQLTKTCALDDLDCVRAGPPAVFRGSLHGQRLRTADGERTFEYFSEGRVSRAH
jgi:Type I phosphodiesterase / nucleotide pyrophosphatase